MNQIGSGSFDDMARARWRISLALTAAMIAIYLGFVLLVAFDKPLLGHLITRGLSVGILLGTLVIMSAWVLTWVYVRWANKYYDSAILGLRR